MNKIQSEEVAVTIDGQPLAGYLAHPAVPGPGVIVLHAWWGLTPFFKELCDRLAAEGFTAFAPDLNFGKTASTTAEAEALMAERDFEQTKSAALAAVAWMQQQEGPGPRLGLVGFSMGAAWALALSSLDAEAVSAVVLFYDVQGIDFSTVRAAFQGHYGEKDEWTKVEWSYEMEKDMRAAGLQVDFYRYPQAGHWFIESDRPDAYRPEDAALAWERTLTFLKQQ